MLFPTAFLLLFLPLAISFNIYVQSNISNTAFDCLTIQTPCIDINTGVNQLINFASGGNLILLPSDKTYNLTNYYFINKETFVIQSFNNIVQNVLLIGNFNMQIATTITFQNLNISRISNILIGSLFYMNGNSQITFESVILQDFKTDGQITEFFTSGPCHISFNNSKLINNDFTLSTAFINVWSNDIVIFNNTIVSNISLTKSAFLKVWDPPSQIILQNTLFSNMNLNIDNKDGNEGSFLLCHGS